MKIYKISQNNDLPPSYLSASGGSCDLAAQIITEKLIHQNFYDFDVIEGYITSNSIEGDIPHTWIEYHDGKIIDPTIDQFDIGNIIYVKHKGKTYTPKKYLTHCGKYIDEVNVDKEKYLSKYSFWKTCTEFEDGNEVYDIALQDELSFDELTFFHDPSQQITKIDFQYATGENALESDVFFGYNKEHDILFKYNEKLDKHFFYTKK